MPLVTKLHFVTVFSFMNESVMLMRAMQTRLPTLSAIRDICTHAEYVIDFLSAGNTSASHWRNRFTTPNHSITFSIYENVST